MTYLAQSLGVSIVFSRDGKESLFTIPKTIFYCLPKTSKASSVTECCLTSSEVVRTVMIRSYILSDYNQVKSLLASLKNIYLGSDIWLEKRLQDVIHNRARCTVCELNETVVGLTIETPKENKGIKLSTIFVHPSFRRCGIASALLESIRQLWVADKVQRVYTTVDQRLVPTIWPLLANFGFYNIESVKDRYCPNNYELVFESLPSIIPSKTVLMSIHSYYASLIYQRRKCYEFRRLSTNIKKDDLVYIYEPKPTAMITGNFRCGQISCGIPSEVCKLEPEVELQKLAEKYTFGTNIASAIEIKFPFKWAEKLPISRVYPNKKPPQSYMFIEEAM